MNIFSIANKYSKFIIMLFQDVFKASSRSMFSITVNIV